MTRIPRTSLPDGFFHVTARGAARGAIFCDDLDYERFRGQLLQVEERYEWTIHAYCLMPNHYHLILEATQRLLSEGMHRLMGLYAQRFNERYNRSGHVFQGRFDSRVIESAEHFDHALAYVHLNPVAARLCASADDWPWTYVDMS